MKRTELIEKLYFIVLALDELRTIEQEEGLTPLGIMEADAIEPLLCELKSILTDEDDEEFGGEPWFKSEEELIKEKLARESEAAAELLDLHVEKSE